MEGEKELQRQNIDQLLNTFVNFDSESDDIYERGLHSLEKNLERAEPHQLEAISAHLTDRMERASLGALGRMRMLQAWIKERLGG